ncbi:MAG: ATP-binding protein [Bacteroidetes bacterium]|jgi:PAS domain S-box-containing protein|nr:ATP-binding protein [Bacteroidota bacterium]
MNFRTIRTFRSSLGPLEQAQIVISTAVVVTLITILAFRVVSGEKLGWYDLISVVTVGVIGFLIVWSTISYGRINEQQKQELLALKTIAEAVNRAIDIPYLLQNALQEAKRLLDVEYAWAYAIENDRLQLALHRGTAELPTTVFPEGPLDADARKLLLTPQIRKRPTDAKMRRGAAWAYDGVAAWASVPIMMKDQFFGVIVVASVNRRAITDRHIDLMTAFANQIGVAMENAALFQRLRKSEEQYMDLFEHSPDMYHIVNRDGIVVSCNQTESMRLQYRKDDIVGQPVFKLYPPSSHASVRRTLHLLFDEGRPVEGAEEQMMTSTGEHIDVSVNTSIIYDEAHRPVLARAVARDITEKKRLEARVLHAQRIDSIGNLAGGVAHDFNNILTSILGSTAIMKRKMRKTDPWFRFVDIIETASRRGAALTRQLLTFARKTNVAFKPIIVNDIVDETLRLFERSIDKTITIRTRLASEICLINGDDGQIQQALLNLLINARDAMPDGGVVTVTTARSDGTGPRVGGGEQRTLEMVAVTVADDGVGMDAATQQHIFEPFFTTKDQGKGTGLGLSVVYGVVNAHNGYIQMQSEEGRGTQFQLFFPLLPASEPARRPTTPKRAVSGRRIARILIVDDEPDVGDVIAGMLSSLGYATTFVDSGRKAMAAYRRGRRYAAVVLDLNMPVMGGRETLLKLREIDPGVRVLISTGYSNKNTDVADLVELADGFLQKPYQTEELDRALRTVLESLRSS